MGWRYERSRYLFIYFLIVLACIVLMCLFPSYKNEHIAQKRTILLIYVVRLLLFVCRGHFYFLIILKMLDVLQMDIKFQDLLKKMPHNFFIMGFCAPENG